MELSFICPITHFIKLSPAHQPGKYVGSSIGYRVFVLSSSIGYRVFVLSRHPLFFCFFFSNICHAVKEEVKSHAVNKAVKGHALNKEVRGSQKIVTSGPNS